MKEGNKKATIYDIAKLSGVAPGTVSRALNHIGYVKKETVEKVESAAKALNYIPTRAAQSLKTKCTGLLLVAIPDMENPFYVQMISAIQAEVRNNGYSMILYYTDGAIEYEVKAFEMMREHIADGMIMVNLNDITSYVPYLKRAHLPLVLCQMSDHMGEEYQEYGFDDICVDTKRSIMELVDRFCERGYQEIGYIGGNPKIFAFADRYQGYCDSLSKHHLLLEERFVVLSENWLEQDGYEAAKALYSRGKLPSAICFSHDLMAVGAMRFFKEQGISLPEELAVSGLDNIDVCEKIAPSLTSVCIHQNQMGRLAAQKVLSRIQQGESEGFTKTVLTGEIIRRASSGKA
ncbi:LacI family DNA-binding transcriptional regulator [Massilimaliae timonensis]|uniref:LacI family DNA-binding transcriptional regulator n=1 Tax=Massiliimalia timonensis TaxID=1987501 RepID=A0A8J6TRG3_9FIRM|nr:LacI family DNA-binding transcriptional regulator [Massiliimalia timonensis]MBC8610721.1 LacI family DNA-binding transcriptional regulator [Massiliimalia timonensis]